MTGFLRGNRAVTVMFGTAALLITHAAQAEPISGEVARQMLFNPHSVEITITDDQVLTAAERETLIQIAQTQKYYGAVALPPDEGLMSPATILAANYHRGEAARAAALAQCDATREGGKACVLVLEIRPADWSDQPLALSADATEGFLRDYSTGSGPRALAISARSGEWGIGTGAAAAEDALARCAAAGEVTDCGVVIQDR